MTRKARIGLLMVLVICVMFMMILSELTMQPQQTDMAAEQQMQSRQYYAKAPVYKTAPKRVVPVRRPAIVPAHQRFLAAKSFTETETLRVNPPVKKRTPRINGRRLHVVKSGDSLIKIARKYYGEENGRLYRLILEANSKTITNADQLKIGMKLLIPEK